MFYVYVLKSCLKNWFYVGMTSDINRRISDHNKGYNRSTKPYAPFELVFIEEYQNSLDARNREKYLKSGVGKSFIKSQYFSNL